MTPEKLARLAELQNITGRARSVAEEMELTALRRELAMAPEVADDPRTLFVDESSRPDVVHGDNYNDYLHKVACDEIGSVLRRVGRAAFDLAVEAVRTRGY